MQLDAQVIHVGINSQGECLAAIMIEQLSRPCTHQLLCFEAAQGEQALRLFQDAEYQVIAGRPYRQKWTLAGATARAGSLPASSGRASFPTLV
jgi:hypothetical protein